MSRKKILILRVIAVVLFVGILAAYICIPHSHMPDGIRTLLSNMKHSLSPDSNPPLILLIAWMLLLIVEIPFALEVKNDKNVFADEYRGENGKNVSAPRHTAAKKTGNAAGKPNAQSGKAKSTAKKKAPAKHTAEKKPSGQKTAAKQEAGKKPSGQKTAAKQEVGKKPKSGSRKAPERKPADRKPTGTKVTHEAKAQKPTKAPAKGSSKAAAPQRKTAGQPAYEPVKQKTPSYSADYRKAPLDDDSFDQFLNDLKNDYLN